MYERCEKQATGWTRLKQGWGYDVKIIRTEGEEKMGLLGEEVDVDNAIGRIQTKVLRVGNHNKDSPYQFRPGCSSSPIECCE